MRTTSVALAMALGIGLLAWPDHARCEEVAKIDFANVLPDVAATDAQLTTEQANWFPAISDPAADPVPHLAARTLASARDTEFTAPAAPLPPAVFAGFVGITVVTWSVYRVKKRGWV
jgi:hypothetical protein